MKYSIETVIDLPRDRVIELFDNLENMYKWQPGLQKHEHVSGTPGEEGAKMKLYYLEGKRKIELLETITKKNLPDQFDGTYETKGMINEVYNTFYDLEDGRTKWVSSQIFRLQGFMKIFGWIMPGAFKKQSLLMHNRFKEFAEGEG